LDIANNNDNVQLLNGLSDDERAIVRQILLDVSENGKSEDLTNLYYEDYEEIPVDLETFLCEEQYLGKYTNYGKDIYETWRKELQFVHNPINFVDQWAITGCLDGSVKIPMLDGTTPTILELYNKHKNNPKNNGKDTIDYLYSYDVNENKYVVGELVRVFFTGIKRVYKLTLDNGQEVICTANHPFLSKSKHWKTLNNGLNTGDSLMSFRREYNDGYEVLVTEKECKLAKQYTHRMVAEYKSGISENNKMYEGHHKDFNPYNNSPNNICVITKTQHKKYHAKYNWKYNENFKKKALESLKNSKNISSEVQSDRSKKRWSKYTSKEERKQYLLEIGCTQFSSEYNKYNHPNLLKIDKQEFIEYAGKCYSKWQVIEHFNMSRRWVY